MYVIEIYIESLDVLYEVQKHLTEFQAFYEAVSIPFTFSATIGV